MIVICRSWNLLRTLVVIHQCKDIGDRWNVTDNMLHLSWGTVALRTITGVSGSQAGQKIRLVGSSCEVAIAQLSMIFFSLLSSLLANISNKWKRRDKGMFLKCSHQIHCMTDCMATPAISCSSEDMTTSDSRFCGQWTLIFLSIWGLGDSVG